MYRLQSRVVPKLQSNVFLEQMLLQYLRNFEICSKLLEDWSKKILYGKQILQDLNNFPYQIPKNFTPISKKFGAHEKICSEVKFLRTTLLHSKNMKLYLNIISLFV